MDFIVRDNRTLLLEWWICMKQLYSRIIIPLLISIYSSKVTKLSKWIECLNPFRRRGWDGIIPTTSGKATSGRNYEFSMSHERQFPFTMSGEATSGRNWDWLEWQVENSPSLPLLLKGLSLSYRKWKLQLWGIGKQSLLVSRDWPIPYS